MFKSITVYLVAIIHLLVVFNALSAHSELKALKGMNYIYIFACKALRGGILHTTLAK